MHGEDARRLNATVPVGVTCPIQELGWWKVTRARSALGTRDPDGVVATWVTGYNCDRPHQALDMGYPADRRSGRGTFPPRERAVVHGRQRRRHRQV